ncbi:DciA family protein [Vandammella animalimorsus]|uniref:DUF721 domain-containing protein n=1 Tax=Vandammella animalimorsus TaxID=2029117 RepID=A0A2A2ABJ3_9BURK|nr:DciA family protein [Vandammella animalimorsus]PAT35094.1 hypothetical protein CK620_04010 [Vandammella animalimorsus]
MQTAKNQVKPGRSAWLWRACPASEEITKTGAVMPEQNDRPKPRALPPRHEAQTACQRAAGTHIGALVQRSPLLAQLTQQAELSHRLLQCIAPHLPAALRAAVQAGPVLGQEWCLIVPNPAAAAKLRHLSPLLLDALAQPGPALQEGMPRIETIRVRVSKLPAPDACR